MATPVKRRSGWVGVPIVWWEWLPMIGNGWHRSDEYNYSQKSIDISGVKPTPNEVELRCDKLFGYIEWHSPWIISFGLSLGIHSTTIDYTHYVPDSEYFVKYYQIILILILL